MIFQPSIFRPGILRRGIYRSPLISPTVRRQIRSMAFVGSSTVNQGFVPDAGAGSNRYFSGSGYYTWTCAWLKQRVMAAYNATDLTYDFGTFGFSNANILATHVPQVIAAAPDAAMLTTGLNDIGNLGLSGSTVWLSTKAIIDPLLAAGIKPIVMLMGPRNAAASGGSGYFSRQVSSNAAIVSGCASMGVQYFDPNPFTQNVSTGDWLPGMSNDGIHPNNYGASVIGKNLALWLEANVNLGPEPFTAERIATLKGINPFMAGGTTLATGYTVFVSGRNAQSKVAATDGGNNWQRLIHSPNSRTDPSQFSLTGMPVSLPAGLAGNLARVWLEMRHESKVDWQSSPGYTAYQIETIATVNGTGGSTAGAIRGNSDAGAAYRVEIPPHGVYVSPVFQVPADATTLSMITSNAGGGTYDYRNWGLEVVPNYQPPAIGS